jgi:hypothetical protein
MPAVRSAEAGLDVGQRLDAMLFVKISSAVRDP